jgi:hypothetical protein
MEEALRVVVEMAEDAVHIVDLGPAAGLALRRVRALGRRHLPEQRRYWVI